MTMRYAQAAECFLDRHDGKSENLSSLRDWEGRRILKSYNETIAFFKDGELFIEGSGASRTTQKHINCVMMFCIKQNIRATIEGHWTTARIKGILSKYLRAKMAGEMIPVEEVTDSIATFMAATESGDYEAFDKISRGKEKSLNKLLRDRLKEKNNFIQREEKRLARPLTGLFRPDKKEITDIVSDWLEAIKLLDAVLDMRARGEEKEAREIFRNRKNNQFSYELMDLVR